MQVQLNLDAHSGDVLTLEDVLWVGQGKPLHYADGDPRSKTLSEMFPGEATSPPSEYVSAVKCQPPVLDLL